MKRLLIFLSIITLVLGLIFPLRGQEQKNHQVQETQLAEFDQKLADQPLGEKIEYLYSERLTLLEELSKTDPKYQQIFDKRKQEIVDIFRTREKELKTAFFYELASLKSPKSVTEREMMLDILNRVNQRLSLLSQSKGNSDEFLQSMEFYNVKFKILYRLYKGQPEMERQMKNYRNELTRAEKRGSDETLKFLRNNAIWELLNVLRQKLSTEPCSDTVLTELFDCFFQMSETRDGCYRLDMFLHLYHPELVTYLNIKQRKVFIERLVELYHTIPDNTKKEIPRLGKLVEHYRIPIKLEGTTVEGKEFSWADYQGKVVLIDFWGEYCVPCIQEFPHLIELYKKYHSKGFEIVGVCSGNDRKQMQKVLEKEQLPWTTLNDSLRAEQKAESMFNHYLVAGTPYPILVDQKGNMILNGDAARGKQLEKYMESLFEKK